jgi:hypothetical protein
MLTSLAGAEKAARSCQTVGRRLNPSGCGIKHPAPYIMATRDVSSAESGPSGAVPNGAAHALAFQAISSDQNFPLAVTLRRQVGPPGREAGS